MSHPAADRQYLAHGLALERRNVRTAFAEELRYAVERLQALGDKFADADATVFSGDTRGGAYTLEEAEEMFGGRRMSCHLDQRAAAHPLRLCAGWPAVVGPHHFRARLSVLVGQLPIEVIHPDTTSWPPLVCDLEELLERRAAQWAAVRPVPSRPGEAEAPDGQAGRTSGARP